jgi:hypothetical protein
MAIKIYAGLASFAVVVTVLLVVAGSAYSPHMRAIDDRAAGLLYGGNPCSNYNLAPQNGCNLRPACGPLPQIGNSNTYLGNYATTYQIQCIDNNRANCGTITAGKGCNG